MTTSGCSLRIGDDVRHARLRPAFVGWRVAAPACFRADIAGAAGDRRGGICLRLPRRCRPCLDRGRACSGSSNSNSSTSSSAVCRYRKGDRPGQRGQSGQDEGGGSCHDDSPTLGDRKRLTREGRASGDCRPPWTASNTSIPRISSSASSVNFLCRPSTSAAIPAAWGAR